MKKKYNDVDLEILYLKCVDIILESDPSTDPGEVEEGEGEI